MFIPNWQSKYKTKSEAMSGIIESFLNVPNAADREGNIIFLLGKNILRLKPKKKKTEEKYEA